MRFIVPVLVLLGLMTGVASAEVPDPEPATVASEGGPYRPLYALAELPPAPVLAVAAIESPQPSDSIADPLDNPVEAYSDLKAAKRLGWSALAFAAVLMLCKVAGRAKSWIGWLGQGKRPLWIAALTAIATAGYNAAAEGGSPLAIATAALVAFAVAYDANGKAQPKTGAA